MAVDYHCLVDFLVWREKRKKWMNTKIYFTKFFYIDGSYFELHSSKPCSKFNGWVLYLQSLKVVLFVIQKKQLNLNLQNEVKATKQFKLFSPLVRTQIGHFRGHCAEVRSNNEPVRFQFQRERDCRKKEKEKQPFVCFVICNCPFVPIPTRHCLGTAQTNSSLIASATGPVLVA